MISRMPYLVNLILANISVMLGNYWVQCWKIFTTLDVTLRIISSFRILKWSLISWM